MSSVGNVAPAAPEVSESKFFKGAGILIIVLGIIAIVIVIVFTQTASKSDDEQSDSEKKLSKFFGLKKGSNDGPQCTATASSSGVSIFTVVCILVFVALAAGITAVLFNKSLKDKLIRSLGGVPTSA